MRPSTHLRGGSFRKASWLVAADDPGPVVRSSFTGSFIDLQIPWTLSSGTDYTRHSEIPSPGNPNINQVTLRTSTPIGSNDPTRFPLLRFSEPVE